METKEIFGIHIPTFLFSLIVVVGYLLTALLLRRMLFRRVAGLAAKSDTKWDDVIVGALRLPVALLILVSTAWVTGQVTDLSPNWSGPLDQFTRVAAIIAMVLFADRFLCGALSIFDSSLKEIHLTQSFARVIVRVAVLVLGGLLVLDTLDISITPMLASLGVGGLAVGLALQGTLSNLFAGVQVISDRPIRVGDFIKLESGEQGYVIEVGWRATKIRMLPNNTVIIPNSKIADSIITNFYDPEKALAVLVQAGVHYDSDLEHVERVTIEVATEIQKTAPGGIRDFVPFIRYHTFDNSSINFTVIMRAGEFVDNYLMKHLFIKQLHARYNREGIVIPFPIRTLDVPPEVLERLGSRPKSPQKRSAPKK